MSETGVWRVSRQVHSYDVDFRQRATTEAVCRWFLEAAWNHAEQLGVGYRELAKEKKLWVLARLLVRIDLYPAWGDELELVTWPRASSSALALRDFEIYSVPSEAESKRMAAGASSWLVLDAATHRPQRLDKLLARISTPVTRMAVERDPKKLPNAAASSVPMIRTVHYSDIDVNHHVNSARYIGWLLDSYPMDFHQKHCLRQLEINYLEETKWGNTAQVFSHQISESEFEHSIFKSGEKEACRARLTWTFNATG